MTELRCYITAAGNNRNCVSVLLFCGTGGKKGPRKTTGKGDGKTEQFRRFRVLVPGFFEKGLVEGFKDIALQGRFDCGEIADAGGQGVRVFTNIFTSRTTYDIITNYEVQERF